MRSVAVIGKNFGDEGKGLVSASLCCSSEHPLIIRHNGGAQAGHTVENVSRGTRMVHHQTGSGSEYGAHTLFAKSFHPDLFVIDRELEEFQHIYRFLPKLYSEAEASITTIDDVLLNMLSETKRGNNRHGSCGMGIYECCLRSGEALAEESTEYAGPQGTPDFKITVGEVVGKDAVQLFEKLRYIREHYTKPRALAIIGRNDSDKGEVLTEPDESLRTYRELLWDDTVLENYARAVTENAKRIEITDANSLFLRQYDQLIFETGQGLLLDENNTRFLPHVTGSKTGMWEAVRFLRNRGMILEEAIYVTRPYVTRHGAGCLPCECDISELPGVRTDATNVKNEWQGSIRYGKHESLREFLQPIYEDFISAAQNAQTKKSLAVTHLDETKDRLYFQEGPVTTESFLKLCKEEFFRIYGAYDRERLVVLKDE